MSTVLPAPPPTAGPLGARSAAERLIRGVRVAFATRAVLRGTIAALAALAVVGLSLVAIDLAVPLVASARRLLRWLPLVAAAVPLAWAALSAGRATPRRLALLVEERVPSLQGRLLTVLETPPGGGGGLLARALAEEVDERVSGIRAGDVVEWRLRRSAFVLAGATALAASFALLFPGPAAAAWERWTRPEDSYGSAWREARASVLPTVATPPIPGFDELRWRIDPPAYAGRRAVDARGEGPIPVLPGSRVRLRSRFPARWDSVRVTRIGAGALPVRRAGREWTAEWPAAPAERGVLLEAFAGGERVASRTAAVVAEADRPPQVELREPREDLVLGATRGRVPLAAVAVDDFGIGDIRLTWIVSRGSGESFTFEEGEWPLGRLRHEGASARGELVLDLATLKLQPGDVIHLRAVARDRNDVTGPGEGVSATRMIRIAKPDEMHTVTTTIGLPAEVEKNPILSQRMLIILTERLRDESARIGRARTEERSRELAYEQGRLRGRVGEQIFTRSTGGMAAPDAHYGFEDEEGGAGGGHAHEGGGHGAEEPGHEEEEHGAPGPDEVLEAASASTGAGTLEEVSHLHDDAPVISVNRTLLAAYNAMWEAERSLQQTEPAAAIPHQYEALRLLQEAQQGERVYARGRVETPPVDVGATRGTGKLDDAEPAPRAGAPALPQARPHLARLEGIASSIEGPGVADELASLAADLLADPRVDPRAAALLSRAADAARAGRTEEAARQLRSARALLARALEGGDRPPVPQTDDPAAAEYFLRLRGKG